MSAPKVLGKLSLAAATAANVFGPLTVGATFNVRITNRGSADATVSIGFSGTSATIDNDQLLVKDEIIPENGTLELTGLACSTEYLVALSDVANVTVIAYGIEV